MSDIQAQQIASDATQLIESGAVTAQNISRVSQLAQNPEALAQALVNIENDIAIVHQLLTDIKAVISPEVAQKLTHFMNWAGDALGYRKLPE